jgi:apolipoprotein D and lipocalin family protein
VDFNLPHTGQCWIIGVDSQYRYAVVSDPSKQSLYVLSKTPTLEPALYAEAVATAALQLDTSKLILTEQMGCTYP